jgi:hypothetical protein
MRHTLRFALPLLAALGACQTPVPAATDAATANDAAGGDAAADAGKDPTFAALRYTPTGCAHSVRTEQGSYMNYRDDRTTFGPMATPSAVHVSWPAEPSSTIAFLWNTDSETHASVVQYGTSRMMLDRTATGHVSTGASGAAQITAHEVHVCGLTPDTTYYYRVGGEGHWSEVQSFKSAPAPGRTDYDVNFAVTGDSRDSFAVWRMVQERMQSVTAMRQPDFEVFSGDAVLLGTIQDAWQQWFAAATPTLTRMPIVMAHGNHDNLAVNYLMQFAQPQNDSEERSELYFSFNYGPVHFVFLNDTARDPAGSIAGTQLTWLRADLTAARANRAAVPFVVAVHHKPAFGSSRYTNDDEIAFIRRTWPPVFDEFGVDVVFNGHEHVFEVSKEIDGMGNEVSGRRGTVYITSAGAGAQLYETGMRTWQRYSESVVNFCMVHATNRELVITPYRGDGTVIEQGRLTRTPRM